MSELHAYLIGDIIIALLFGFVFYLRKDLRRVMIYSGFLYLLITTPCFFALKLLSHDVAKSVTPGYWSPPTLFNIGQKTGGLAIEDELFIFFASGLAAVFYDFLFATRVGYKRDRKIKKGHAILAGLIAGFAVYALTPINAMYFLIIFQFVGAVTLIVRRRDLFKHSLYGGIAFLFLYFVMYSLFNMLFPNFVPDFYHLQRTSHILVAGIPIEELMYGFTFGLLWSPIYEYEFRLKDKKSRKLGLRRVFLAAATTRR